MNPENLELEMRNLDSIDAFAKRFDAIKCLQRAEYAQNERNDVISESCLLLEYLTS